MIVIIDNCMQNTRSRASATRKMNFKGSEAVKTLKLNNSIVKTMVLEPPDQGPGDDFRVAALDFALQIHVATRKYKNKRLAAPHQCKILKSS